MNTIKRQLDEIRADIQALNQKRNELVKRALGEGLRSVFQEYPELWQIRVVRYGSYDDNYYYDASGEPVPKRISINGGQTIVRSLKLEDRLSDLFRIDDSELDTVLGAWSEFRATWNRVDNSVDIDVLP